MRRLPARLAYADIDRRLTEINRLQLAVDIGDMQQRHIAERVELQQLGLAHALLSHRACETAADRQRRGGRANLEDFTAGDHRGLLFLRMIYSENRFPLFGIMRRSTPDARHAEFEALALRRQIHLKVAILLGIGRQFISADVDLTPLEALANVPDLLLAGAPGREMVVLALQHRQPLPANPVIGGFAVAIGAGEIEFAELTVRQRLATLRSRLRRRAHVDVDRLAIGEK